MSAQKKRVVIVGAGPSGLVALKEMVEAGHDARIVEQSHVIGGVFSTLADSTYDGLYLTISNVFMSYSDYPCAEEEIRYSKKEEYAKYLEAYATNFDLLEKIDFETKVESAKLGADGVWKVACSKKDGTTVDYEVDSLVVCTGSNQTPKKTPDNVAKFEGKILHSSEFQNAASFKGEKVLVVGTGESASDIACEIAQVAKETTVWARRPFILAPRFTAYQNFKQGYDELEWLTNEKHWRDCTVGDFLESATTSRAVNSLPVWLYASIRQLGWGFMEDMKNVSPGVNYLGRYSKACAGYDGVPRNVYFQADQAAWATKNSRIADMAGRGELRVVVSPTAEFSGKTAKFKETILDPVTGYRLAEPIELTQDFDTVVCCTGYTNDFYWLETDPKYGELCSCPRTWYKHCWPPGFDDKLAFIGWARPHQGGIPQTSELCSRFHALLLSGERSLPDDIQVKTAAEAKAENDFYVLSPNLTSLVDWPSFSTSLARMIGCEPARPWFITSPITWLKYWFFPMWSCWYRLRGPGAKPEAYHTIMNRFNIFGARVLTDPAVACVTMPFFLVQKCVINVFTYIFKPFRRSAAMYGVPTLFDRSKINILHGCDLKLKNLLTMGL